MSDQKTLVQSKIELNEARTHMFTNLGLLFASLSNAVVRLTDEAIEDIRAARGEKKQ